MIEDIEPPPDLQSARACRAINGIGKTGEGVKPLLDCEALLDDEKSKIFDNSTRRSKC